MVSAAPIDDRIVNGNHRPQKRAAQEELKAPIIAKMQRNSPQKERHQHKQQLQQQRTQQQQQQSLPKIDDNMNNRMNVFRMIDPSSVVRVVAPDMMKIGILPNGTTFFLSRFEHRKEIEGSIPSIPKRSINEMIQLLASYRKGP